MPRKNKLLVLFQLLKGSKKESQVVVLFQVQVIFPDNLIDQGSLSGQFFPANVAFSFIHGEGITLKTMKQRNGKEVNGELELSGYKIVAIFGKVRWPNIPK